MANLLTPEDILGENHMRAVMEELQGFAYWKQLGIKLGVDQGKLNIIEDDASNNYGRLSKVIEHWLKRNHNEEECGHPTWGNLAKAIKPIDNARALKIEGKYGISSGTADVPPIAGQPLEPPPSIAEEPTHVTRRPIQKPPKAEQIRVPERQQRRQPPSINEAEDHEQRTAKRPTCEQSPSTYLPSPWVCLGVSVVFLAIVGGVWFGVPLLATPLPSSNNARTCDQELPKLNSDPVKVQERQIKNELAVEEMSDKLKTSVERVGNALIAGEKCKDPELSTKMNLVNTIVKKIKERVQQVYGGFHDGANTALSDLRSVWKFATKGNMDEAMQQMKSVCETTEALAQQLDSLKGSLHIKETELHLALKDLESYQGKAKHNHETQQHELLEEKQRLVEKLNTYENLAREAEEKATIAKKEMEAWEELKRNNDEFGSADESTFKKRRDQFLKDQRTFEAEAEDSRRIMEQTRIQITSIGRKIEATKDAFNCTNDAITKMREAAGSVSMPDVRVSLFEEGLKTECADLHDEIKSISSSGGPKGTCRSQVCNKAIKLFAKWQALSKVSLDYLSIGDM